jgi:hypothetical protein
VAPMRRIPGLGLMMARSPSTLHTGVLHEAHMNACMSGLPQGMLQR